MIPVPGRRGRAPGALACWVGSWELGSGESEGSRQEGLPRVEIWKPQQGSGGATPQVCLPRARAQCRSPSPGTGCGHGKSADLSPSHSLGGPRSSGEKAGKVFLLLLQGWLFPSSSPPGETLGLCRSVPWMQKSPPFSGVWSPGSCHLPPRQPTGPHSPLQTGPWAGRAVRYTLPGRPGPSYPSHAPSFLGFRGSRGRCDIRRKEPGSLHDHVEQSIHKACFQLSQE